MENVTSAPIAGSSVYGMIVWIAVIFAIMYFLMIRPNKKRMDEYKDMLNKLKVGSKIVFAGGIMGVVKSVGENTLKVEIADGVVIEIPKAAVANII